ncbi:MAG: biotin--[Paludibacteraceae bacterium]|nr:biotin--[acetyl-CoA-carboxylase] ligase [Paludibacteraceae bacterium]
MYIASTNSTNTLLKELIAKGQEPRFIYAGYQTAGRGQTGNSWESEKDKNLICSILLPPNKNLYFLNIAVGVAIIRVIQSFVFERSGLCSLSEAVSIKWPNDIYWKDKKLAGILLENAIIGNEVKYAIAGIGLNVNQTEFVSDAPNPVSLKQIYGTDFDIEKLMQDLLDAVHTVLKEPEETIWSEYKAHLYRREGYWLFEDKNGIFEALIDDVLPTGEIVLCDKNGQNHPYGFKQIKYRI